MLGAYENDDSIAYSNSQRNNYTPMHWSKAVSVRFLEMYYQQTFNNIMHNDELTKEEKNIQVDNLILQYKPLLNKMIDEDLSKKKRNG